MAAAWNGSAALRRGDFQDIVLTNRQCVFRREAEGERVFVAGERGLTALHRAFRRGLRPAEGARRPGARWRCRGTLELPALFLGLLQGNMSSAGRECSARLALYGRMGAQRRLERRQMCCSSAAFTSSSRNWGWAREMRLSARSQVLRPARLATPFSVAM